MPIINRTDTLGRCGSPACIALAFVLAAIALGPRSAAARFEFRTVCRHHNVEHNSNVFSLPSTGTQGITSLGDTISEFTAGANTDLDWGQNSLKLNVEGRHFLYNHYSYLGHNEYTAGGELDWHFGPVVETELSYTQSHSAASFADTLTTQLEVRYQQDRRGAFSHSRDTRMAPRANPEGT